MPTVWNKKTIDRCNIRYTSCMDQREQNEKKENAEAIILSNLSRYFMLIAAFKLLVHTLSIYNMFISTEDGFWWDFHCAQAQIQVSKSALPLFDLQSKIYLAIFCHFSFQISCTTNVKTISAEAQIAHLHGARPYLSTQPHLFLGVQYHIISIKTILSMCLPNSVVLLAGWYSVTSMEIKSFALHRYATINQKFYPQYILLIPEVCKNGVLGASICWCTTKSEVLCATHL